MSFNDEAASAATEDEEVQNNVDPWPYLKNYFKFMRGRDERNVTYQCLACLPMIKELSVSRRSYSNLKKHYKSVHGSSYAAFLKHLENAKAVTQKSRKRSLMLKDAQPENPEPPLKQLRVYQSLAQGKFSQNKYEDKLLDLFISNMIPLGVIESESFKEFVKYCAPSAKDISRRTLTRRIEDRFLDKKKQLKLMLQDVASVATTADAWSCRNRCFLGMTVHWIEKDNLRRQKAVLACRRLKGRHTFDVLANMIQKIHWEFEIDGKVCMTTTDNGSNFVKAFSAFGTDVETDQTRPVVSSTEPMRNEGDDDDDHEDVEVNQLTDILQEDSGVVHIELPNHNRCAAHTLNLIATSDANKAMSCASFKKTSRAVFAKAQALWNKQSRSPQAAEIIKSELEVLLVIPSQTRWNSVYDSFCRLKAVSEDREKRAALNRVCSSLNLTAFSNGDVAFLSEYVKVMKPLCQALDILQSEEKAYYGIFLPTVAVCAKRLADIDEVGGLSFCKPLLSAVREGLKKRFGKYLSNIECLVAAASHPHFKLSWLAHLHYLGCEDVEALRNKVCEIMVRAIAAMNSLNGSDSLGANNQSASSEEEFFAGALTARTTSKNSSSQKLVNDFITEGHGSQSKEIGSLLPNNVMKALFIKYNTPIPSSAAVERLFSLGKDVLKPKRTGLTDEHFEMLVFLKE